MYRNILKFSTYIVLYICFNITYIIATLYIDYNMIDCPIQCESQEQCKCGKIYKKEHVSVPRHWYQDEINKRAGCLLKYKLAEKDEYIDKNDKKYFQVCVDDNGLQGNGINLRIFQSYTGNGFNNSGLKVTNAILTHGSCINYGVVYHHIRDLSDDPEELDRFASYEWKRYCARIVKYKSPYYNIQYPNHITNEYGVKIIDDPKNPYKKDKLCIFEDPYNKMFLVGKNKGDLAFKDEFDIDPLNQIFHQGQTRSENGQSFSEPQNKSVIRVLGCVAIELEPNLPTYSAYKYPSMNNMISLNAEGICPKNSSQINNIMPCQVSNKLENSFINNVIRLSYSWKMSSCDVRRNQSCVDINNIDKIPNNNMIPFCKSNSQTSICIKNSSKDKIFQLCKKIRGKDCANIQEFRAVYADKIGQIYENYRFTQKDPKTNNIGYFYGIDIGEFDDFSIDLKNNQQNNQIETITKDVNFFTGLSKDNKPKQIKLSLTERQICATYQNKEIGCIPRHYTDNKYSIKKNIDDFNYKVILSSGSHNITKDIVIPNYKDIINNQNRDNNFVIANLIHSIRIHDDKSLTQSALNKYNNNCKYRNIEEIDYFNRIKDITKLQDINNIFNLRCGTYIEDFRINQIAKNDEDLNKEINSLFLSESSYKEDIKTKDVYNKVYRINATYIDNLEYFQQYYIRGGKFACLSYNNQPKSFLLVYCENNNKNAKCAPTISKEYQNSEWYKNLPSKLVQENVFFSTKEDYAMPETLFTEISIKQFEEINNLINNMQAGDKKSYDIKLENDKTINKNIILEKDKDNNIKITTELINKEGNSQPKEITLNLRVKNEMDFNLCANNMLIDIETKKFNKCQKEEKDNMEWQEANFNNKSEGKCIQNHILTFNQEKDIPNYVQYCNRSCGIGPIPKNELQFSYIDEIENFCINRCKEIKEEALEDNIIKNIKVNNTEEVQIIKIEPEPEPKPELKLDEGQKPKFNLSSNSNLISSSLNEDKKPKYKVELKKNQGEIIIKIKEESEPFKVGDSIEFEIDVSKKFIFAVSDNVRIFHINNQNNKMQINKLNSNQNVQNELENQNNELENQKEAIKINNEEQKEYNIENQDEIIQDNNQATKQYNIEKQNLQDQNKEIEFIEASKIKIDDGSIYQYLTKICANKDACKDQKYIKFIIKPILEIDNEKEIILKVIHKNK